MTLLYKEICQRRDEYLNKDPGFCTETLPAGGAKAPHLLALPDFGFAPFRLCFLQDERYLLRFMGK